MCYDINFTVQGEELADYFPDLIYDTQIKIDFETGHHIIGQLYAEHPIIYASQQDGKLHCRAMDWGLIPHYTQDVKAFLPKRTLWLNARSEKVLDDAKSYWHTIRNRRCLIPVNGFYEHRAITGWKKKVPYLLRLKDQPLFFLPGLYAVVEVPDLNTGEMVKRWTFTILTRKANELMKNIHNDGENRHRMPLMLPFDLAKEFVQKDLAEDRYRAILDYEMSPERMTYDTVYTIRSNKLRPDGKIKSEHWEWDKLPELGLCNPD